MKTRKRKRQYTDLGKSGFTVACMESNTLINNSTRKNSVFCTHNCKPTLLHPIFLTVCKKAEKMSFKIVILLLSHQTLKK